MIDQSRIVAAQRSLNYLTSHRISPLFALIFLLLESSLTSDNFSPAKIGLHYSKKLFFCLLGWTSNLRTSYQIKRLWAPTSSIRYWHLVIIDVVETTLRWMMKSFFEGHITPCKTLCGLYFLLYCPAETAPEGNEFSHTSFAYQVKGFFV